MIKAIVYDLDGMLFNEPHYFSKELQLKYGIDSNDCDFSNDPNYTSCKIGKISFESFFSPYVKKWNKKCKKFNLNISKASKEWFDFTVLNKDMLEIARNLKSKGIMNFILTNNTKSRIKYLDKKYNLSKYFKIIGSFDLGVLKPDKRFYDVLIKKSKLKPEEILIFDDKEDNIQIVKNMGFKGEVYKNLKALKKIISSYNLK